jgi:hypothetical protein
MQRDERQGGDGRPASLTGLDLGYASRLHTGQSLERQLGYFSGEDLEFCIRRAASRLRHM